MIPPIRTVQRTLVAALLTAGVVTAATARAGEPAGAPAGSPAAPHGALALGAEAPLRDVAMKGVDGKSYSIASVAGKRGTLVIFICNHCPWVKRWQSRITAIGNAALADGIGVIAINPNDPGAFPEDAFDVMVTRARTLGMSFPYVMDATSDVGRDFGATHTPEAFLFDAAGKLVYHGGVDDNAEDARAVTQPWLHDAVVAVAAGKPVALAETKTLGCTVKLRAPATR